MQQHVLAHAGPLVENEAGVTVQSSSSNFGMRSPRPYNTQEQKHVAEIETRRSQLFEERSIRKIF